jgi:hypothetical protein
MEILLNKVLISTIVLVWMPERNEHQITDQQESRDKDGKAKKTQVFERIDQTQGDVGHNSFRMKEQIPAIPALEPSQVDPQPAQSQGNSHKKPAC